MPDVTELLREEVPEVVLPLRVVEVELLLPVPALRAEVPDVAELLRDVAVEPVFVAGALTAPPAWRCVSVRSWPALRTVTPEPLAVS